MSKSVHGDLCHNGVHRERVPFGINLGPVLHEKLSSLHVFSENVRFWRLGDDARTQKDVADSTRRSKYRSAA